MDESLKADVMYWAAFYERRMRIGNKKIFHLEAWVVKVMSLYKVMSTSMLWIGKRWGNSSTPTSPCGLDSESHPPVQHLTDDLHSASLQHYFFEVDMDDLTAFD